MGDTDKLKKEFEQEFSQAAETNHLEQLRIKFLGRKGLLTQILRSLKDLPITERKSIGQIANRLKEEWEHKVDLRLEDWKRKAESVKALDVTRPGKKVGFGHLHPLTQTLQEVVDIFLSMGFSVAEGPEIETEYYNFDALNIPAEHPARDLWDTLWLKPQIQNSEFRIQNLLLRTHTSPVQIRYMEKHNPPLHIISPGQVFRHEATDATHSFQFWQLEGLLVDEQVSLANLRAVVETFLSRFFKKKVETKMIPSYFPFVEPGVQFNMKCPFCSGKGCPSCAQAGWLEIMGAGMVHPQVFKNVGYETDRWTGFAFGVGLDRLVMHKYGIPDIRLLYSGDLRFVRQF